MSTEDDKPLPISFWDTDALGAAVGDGGTNLFKLPAPTLDPVQEMREWEPTFESLGTTLVEAMTQHYSKTCQYHNLVMYSYEDVYRHLVAQREQDIDKYIFKGEPATLPTMPAPAQAAPPAPAVEKSKTELYAARAAAKHEWREAVRQKKEAIRHWEDYVMQKRKQMEELS